MLFPTVKDEAAANSLQFADIQFTDQPDGNGTWLLFGDPVIAIGAATPDSSYPAAEEPPFAIDGLVYDQIEMTSFKYLNFGQENSGFIATPSGGSSVVESFQITTANDAVERDPAMWEFYGTNDPIASADNSQGGGEDWTLSTPAMSCCRRSEIPRAPS